MKSRILHFKCKTWDSKGSQNSRLVFGLGIMLTVIQEKVGIDQGNEKFEPFFPVIVLDVAVMRNV